MKKDKIKILPDSNINEDTGLNIKFVLFSFLTVFILLYWKLFLYPSASVDTISQFYPIGTFNKQYFMKHFYLPFWNPYICCGYPNLDYGFYYNLIFLIAYISPLQLGVNISYSIITLLGGLFAYIFFKSLNLNKYTALFSGIIYMIAGNIVSCIYPGHLGKPLVTALVPLIFFFINKGFDTKKIYHFMIAGFLIGFQFLGHPQIFYYSLILCSLFYFFKAYWEFQENKSGKLIIKAIINFGIIGLSAILISFNHLILSITYSKLSSRGAGISPVDNWDFATSWSMHPIELLTYFIPSLFGLYDSTYMGWRPFMQSTDYIGFITIVIAFIGIIAYWQKKEIKFITFFSLFTMFFGMGKHFPAFYKLFYNYFPLIKKFRVPSSIYLITTFCLLFLFVYGFNALIKIKDNYKLKKKVNITIISFIILLIILTFFINSDSYREMLKNNLGSKMNISALYQQYPAQAEQYINNIISQPSEMAKGDLKLIWIFFSVFLLFFYLFNKNNINKKTFIILTGIIIIIDMLVIDKKFIKTVDNYDIVAKETDIIKVIKKFQEGNEKFRISPIPASIDNESNKWTIYDIESAFGYNSLALGIYDDALKYGWFGNLKLLGLMNVKYLLSKQEINSPELELVYRGSQLIYKNNKFLPRYFFIDRYKLFNKKDEILNYMNSPAFDPKKEIILEEDIGTNVFSAKDNNIQLAKWSYDEFELAADVKNKCLLFLSEVYYPKWRAYINDKEIKIYKANYLFRAVILPKGQYKIKFKFYNDNFYILSSIFHYILTLSILIGIYLLIRKKRI